MEPSVNSTKEKTFWKWFEKNQDEVFDFEKDCEAILDLLMEEISNVDQNLTFEISPIRPDGTREFVISADGIRESFPSVEALYAVAPELPRWRFLKYRPRRVPDDLNSIKLSNMALCCPEALPLNQTLDAIR